jgi:hypothetical protein
LVVVFVGGEDGFPERFAVGDIQANGPLFAVRLRFGEGSSAGFDDGAFAGADDRAPEFLGTFVRPLPQKAGGGINVVAVIGRKRT